MAEIKFISGDGVEHTAEEGSIAAQIMIDNGFQRIYSEAEAEAAAQAEVSPEAEAAEPPAKPNSPKARSKK